MSAKALCAPTDAGRHDPQIVFVDEFVVEQSPIQRGDAIFHDVPTIFSFELGKLFGHIAFEK